MLAGLVPAAAAALALWVLFCASRFCTCCITSAGGGGWLQVLCYVLAHFVEVSVQHKMGGSGTLAAGAVSAEAIAQSG